MTYVQIFCTEVEGLLGLLHFALTIWVAKVEQNFVPKFGKLNVSCWATTASFTLIF